MVIDTMHIAFICDDNYALCTGVAITSLKKVRDKSANYHVHVLCNKVSDDKIALFEQLNEANFNIDIIDLSKNSYCSAFERTSYAKHVSPTALYKFALPEIFESIDKILYLDGDIIIRDNLTQLFEIDIETCYAAVCKDFGAETFPAPFNKRLHIHHKDYFNSGVMLLNLKKMRTDRISEKLRDYREHGINHYMDQDAFNVIFNEEVVYFPYLYNMTISSWVMYSCAALNTYYNTDLPEKANFFLQAKILHLSSPEKPWKFYNVIGAEEWMGIYIDSPFINLPCNRNYYPNSYRERIAEELNYWELVPQKFSDESCIVNPLVSVVIPVYNSEKYLYECIDSLITQTLHCCEFIFVDDGSTDSSLEILKAYQKVDCRISVFRQANKHAGVARNNGLSHARGEFITFLDSDDIMLPYALEEFYRRAVTTGADIVISSAYKFEKKDGYKEVAGWCLRKEFLPFKPEFSVNNYSKYLFQITAGAPWGKIYRRSLIQENGIIFPTLPRAEDFHFVYWSFAVAKRIVTIDDQLIMYRIINESGSLENAKDKYPLAPIDGYILLWDKICELGKEETLKATFNNIIVSGVSYNLRTMKTGEGFEKLFNAFRNEVVEKFDLDFSSSDSFYFKGDYAYLKEIYEANSFSDYMFKKLQVTNVAKNLPSKATPSKTAILSNQNYDFYKNEVIAIRSSASYRIGRFITFIPRKIRGGIRCYNEHGMRYTMRRIKEKFRNLFRKKTHVK